MIKLMNPFNKYKKYILIVIGIILLLTLLIFVSNKISQRQVNAVVVGLQNEWTLKNQALIEELTILKERQKNLEANYNAQKKRIKDLENYDTNKYKEVKKSNDKKAFAVFFDNTIDSSKQPPSP